MDVAFFSILNYAYQKNNANCFAHCIGGTTVNPPFLLKSILKLSDQLHWEESRKTDHIRQTCTFIHRRLTGG